MKKIYFFLMAFYFFGNVNAQSPNIVWEKIFGGTALEMATAIRQTSDGGYIFVAFTDSVDGDVGQNNGNTDLWVVKVNELGVIQWQQAYGGSDDEYARAIQQTADGGYIIMATTLSNDGDVLLNHGQTDYWVVKLTSSGIIEWQKSFGGGSIDDAYDIKQTADGGYILVGDSITSLNSYAINPLGDNDVWLVKLNAVGTIEWEKSLGGQNDDNGYEVSQTIDGGYIVVGYTWSFYIDSMANNGGADFYVAKLNTLGNLEWQKMIGGSDNDFAYDVVQLNDGSYVVSGQTFSTDNGIINHGAQDGLIVKLDSSGVLLWQKAMGGTDYDGFENVKKTSDGKIIVAGYTNSNNGDVTDYYGSQDGWIVELDANGVLQWQKTYGSSGIEGIEDIEQTLDGGFIMAGTKAPLYGNISTYNCWIVKLNSGLLTTNNLDKLDVKLYPNPVKDALRINLDPNIIIKSVFIYNILGQLVQVDESTTEMIDVSRLGIGSYFVKIISDIGSSSGKFIKE